MKIQMQLRIIFRQPVVKLAGERLRRVHDVGVELVLSGMEPFARVVEADIPEKIHCFVAVACEHIVRVTPCACEDS